MDEPGEYYAKYNKQWIIPYLSAKLWDGSHQGTGPTRVSINAVLSKQLMGIIKEILNLMSK